MNGPPGALNGAPNDHWGRSGAKKIDGNEMKKRANGPADAPPSRPDLQLKSPFFGAVKCERTQLEAGSFRTMSSRI